jgi:hypothetical protein
MKHTKQNTEVNTLFEKGFKIGDKLECIDGTDSHGILKLGSKYNVIDTDGIRVQLENKPLT